MPDDPSVCQEYMLNVSLTDRAADDVPRPSFVTIIYTYTQYCYELVFTIIYLILKIVHRLQPGEAVTFNNRRVMHKRTPIGFNGGVRHLQV